MNENSIAATKRVRSKNRRCNEVVVISPPERSMPRERFELDGS
jgi:hypothetical protein